ncbi:metal-dependent hydrolase [Desulfurococcaceae archaeon MEX13E-LK6-19]|nr:metal-dependent hydrolase [Desulfurococcaceae archaeon MEX13E-LK6-19]
MRRSVHALMGASLGVLLAWNNALVFFPSLIFGWIGGYFPDIDLKFRHRKSLHNIFAIATATVIIYVGAYSLFVNWGTLEPKYIPLYSKYMALSFLLGALAHVFFDSFTPRGVFILWPISSARLRLGRIKSDNKFYNGFGIFISILIFFLWMAYSTGLVNVLREFS